MPRPHLPGASSLRNRNRITNKTRLRIIKGNVDAEDVFIPDEEEEKHRLTNLVAGVDAEDANEVLSAAHRTQVTKKVEDKSAYIPTPDSTGVVDNADELYPPGRWRDPATYVCTSAGVEESVANGIAGGFTYYMDERDKEWLDKNNEEARGEGTSAQGAISSASGTRTSARSAKAKGKEPDVNQPTTISEDEFELVMGLFEKVAHEKTEFLHLGLVTGANFPPFSEYESIFSSPLTPATFAAYTVPSWIPQPPHLLRLARIIYPYWRERRLERQGHRIIPTLNFDETDTTNESYICFRRREIKAVRKTRQTQVTFSDKLARLQTEFAYPLELAKLVLQREMVKKECAVQGRQIWERRLALVDLKRKFPSFSGQDEELLVDKERPKKDVVRVPPRPPRPTEVLTPIPQVVIKPRERIAQVKQQIEATLAKQKEVDRSWEDVVDNPYQAPPVPFASRLFQYVPPSDAPSYPSNTSDKTSDSDEEPPAKVPRISRAVRLRYGRGGRLLMDRRDPTPRRPIPKAARSSLFGGGDDDMQVDVQDPEEVDRLKRLEAQWRFDADDGPPCGPDGPDEQDRLLLDDYDPKYLRYAMTLFTDTDHAHLSTDPTIHLPNANGQQSSVIPYRLGMPPMVRRDPQGNLRPIHPVHGMFLGPVPYPGLLATPVAMQHQIKKMPPPNALPQMRISSNGGMRPPSVPGVALAAVGPQQSPPPPTAIPQNPATNGIARPAIAMPHVDLVKPAEPVANGTPALASQQAAERQTSPPQEMATPANGISPQRPKSQNQTPMALGVPTNGYHLTSLNPASAATAAAAYAQLQANQRAQLMLQQKTPQDIKAAFANAGLNLTPQDLAALQAQAATNRAMYANSAAAAQLAAGNLNLKLPAARQMQWALGMNLQRPGSAVPVNNAGGGEGGGTQVQMGQAQMVNGVGIGIASPNPQHMIPVRSPSANGMRPGMRISSTGQMQQMSPHMQHSSPSPLPNIAQQSQSPPRVPMTPAMVMASPPQQQNGY
ncbi:NuA4 histone acetyltransferase subunit [Coprinopsis cinerea okayama7|uniref:Enhancer of polycomb-like protein n=1 Tax=Coprinopsis cinerea (strain Okayama-7 / 130 / ATCC MYA-4618 / FGSC 9003) TaxID=240176 RepID=A8NAH1_COPC7|nr:NuA4 histone acetyltransferase subunit [Coprinopsis cinerea okayama7\|eukprot:XP_001831823.2 NuA4 histone acetyltransferase subunit [Coprinopsis cinerea okayama7\